MGPQALQPCLRDGVALSFLNNDGSDEQMLWFDSGVTPTQKIITDARGAELCCSNKTHRVDE